MTTEVVLPVWVIYDHPRDQPDWFVVRRHYALSDGTTTADGTCYGFHELEQARAWLAEKGLTQLARFPGDDPVIVETWL